MAKGLTLKKLKKIAAMLKQAEEKSEAERIAAGVDWWTWYCKKEEDA